MKAIAISAIIVILAALGLYAWSDRAVPDAQQVESQIEKPVGRTVDFSEVSIGERYGAFTVSSIRPIPSIGEQIPIGPGNIELSFSGQTEVIGILRGGEGIFDGIYWIYIEDITAAPYVPISIESADAGVEYTIRIPEQIARPILEAHGSEPTLRMVITNYQLKSVGNEAGAAYADIAASEAI